MVILIVIIVVIVVFVLASFIAGVFGAPRPGSGDADPGDRCADCRLLREWWATLKWWQKAGYSGFYALQMVDCAIKGC